MSEVTTASRLEELKAKLPALGAEFPKFGEVLTSLLETLQISSKKKFAFLLVGRTGVGKSSTINTLMGCEVAPTADFEPETMDVKPYETEINGIQFTVINTPGLCDSLSEENDQVYLEMMRSKAKQVDLMWFVTPLNEFRVRRDELYGLRLITEAFGLEVWKHSIIVFTCADLVNELKYQETLEKRTELIRKAIADCIRNEANDIPAVAVTNLRETTPDGKKWLGELYIKVLTRISERSALPFFLATANRVTTVTNSTQNLEDTNYNFGSNQEPNWRFYGAGSIPKIELDDLLKKEVKKVINASIIPGLAVAGAGLGLPFGAVGAAIGGAIGAAIGLIAWLLE